MKLSILLALALVVAGASSCTNPADSPTANLATALKTAASEAPDPVAGEPGTTAGFDIETDLSKIEFNTPYVNGTPLRRGGAAAPRAEAEAQRAGTAMRGGRVTLSHEADDIVHFRSPWGLLGSVWFDAPGRNRDDVMAQMLVTGRPAAGQPNHGCELVKYVALLWKFKEGGAVWIYIDPADCTANFSAVGWDPQWRAYLPHPGTRIDIVVGVDPEMLPTTTDRVAVNMTVPASQFLTQPTQWGPLTAARGQDMLVRAVFHGPGRRP